MAEVRRLGSSDQHTWAELRLALWPDGTRAEFLADIEKLCADADRQPAFGIFEAGHMIGFAEAAEREWGNGCVTAPVAWVEGIYVVPDHRHLGLASQLIEAIIVWAKARGLTELGSDVAIDNEASLHSHERWGFVETERLVVLKKDI